MSRDDNLFNEYLKQLADRYTAAELVEHLDLDVWDVIEAFSDFLQDNYVELNED